MAGMTSSRARQSALGTASYSLASADCDAEEILYSIRRLLMLSPLRRLPIARSSFCRSSVGPTSVVPVRTPPLLRFRAIACLAPHRTPRHPHPTSPSRSAVDLYSLGIAAVLSLGIAYIAINHIAGEQQLEGLEHSHATSDQPLEMASQMPPGRPGNLTAEQEVKLKQMWAVLNDLCGLTGSRTSDSTERPLTTESVTDEKKKKRKSRLSLFGRKDKDDVDASGDSADDDKHGQKKEYQQALASMTPQQLRESLWSMCKHDDPDALILRFLRARKWDVQPAVVMLISTMHWRGQEAHVDDDIMLRGEAHALAQSQSSDADEKKDGEDFLAQMRMGKSFVHGLDKENRPCCFVRVRLHRQGEQNVKSLERFTIYEIETTRMLLRPPIDTATVVFDMTDFSMANMDYTPVKFMIKVFEANYPESLGSVLVYKAPWVFQGVWRIIKGWLDPVVASKIHFASNVSDLAEWVPRSQIPKELGGDEDWTYTYVDSTADENTAFQDPATRDRILEERQQLVNSYEAATLTWVSGDDAGADRPRLAQRLAENYWRLDPYIRARSLYDRLGVLGPGGKLDFYPRSTNNGAAHADDNVD